MAAGLGLISFGYKITGGSMKWPKFTEQFEDYLPKWYKKYKKQKHKTHP